MGVGVGCPALAPEPPRAAPLRPEARLAFEGVCVLFLFFRGITGNAVGAPNRKVASASSHQGASPGTAIHTQRGRERQPLPHVSL